LFVCLFRVRYIGSYLILIKKKPKYIYTGGGSFPPQRESNARIREIGSPI